MTQSIENRYERILKQLEELFQKTRNPLARMASTSAVLFHKMPHFSWCGFYLLTDGELLVGPYQGPLACMKLEKDRGVCWAGINQKEAVIITDVNDFPGHIACDPRSRSEIVIPLFNGYRNPVGVLDVDSTKPGSFNETDARGLEKIAALIYA